MITPFIDLHTHTTCSDGSLTPQQLVQRAHSAGIRILSITDHNYTESLEGLRKEFPDMTLIQGAEVSCLYKDGTGLEHELHVVGLGFDPGNEEMKAVLEHNRPDRRPYINAILAKLRTCGIDLGTFDDICAKFPETKYIGRMAVARCLFEGGYTASIDEAFEQFLGANGERRAYVKNSLRFVSLAEAVRTILVAGGVPVLAHLMYYDMDEAENEHLVRRFKNLAGDRGAMEVFYSRYDASKRLYLLKLCKKYHLMPSAASDYHAQEVWERLDNRFSYSVCGDILKSLNVEVVDAIPPFQLLVLSGFSGVGKGTISKVLMSRAVGGYPIQTIRSVTTRKPRDMGKKDTSIHDDYTYIDRDTFDKMVQNYELLEYNASYGANAYGTPINEVRSVIEAGAVPCLEIDRIGLTHLLTDGKIAPENIRSAFVVAPAIDIAKRLHHRGTESESVICTRLETAIRESDHLDIYDAVVENAVVETAVETVLRCFEGQSVADKFDAERFRAEMRSVLTTGY